MDTIRRGDDGGACKVLQRLLNEQGANLVVDGDFGPATDRALRGYQRDAGLDVDGVAGPATWRSLKAEAQTVPAPPVPAELDLPPEADLGSGGVIRWDHFDGPETRQPRNRSELKAQFGNPGEGKVDPAWKKKWLRSYFDAMAFPGTENLIRGRYVTVHTKVEPYLREALRRAMIACPDFVIEVLGCFNFRHMRHDESKPLSVHAFAAAVDVNPADNFARRFARGESPQAFTPEWWAIWPNGLPQNFVEAFKSCGWAWGSDWDEDGDTEDTTYHDPMHFEWVARDGESRHV